MTIADDITWLENEAAWLKAVDTAFFPTGGVSLLATTGGLALAASNLQADWTKAHPTDLLDAGPLDATNAIKAIGAAYGALYRATTQTRLQDDAARLLAIAVNARDNNAATADDINWLTAEVGYLNNIDAVLSSSDSSVGLQSAANALSSSGMAFAAGANGDSTGAIAVGDAINAMNKVYNAVYSQPGNGVVNAALHLQSVIIPDLQKLVPAPIPVVAIPPGPIQLPGTVPGTPAPTTNAPSTAMSTTTFVVGAAAFVGVGWLAWYLTKKRRTAPQPQRRLKTRRTSR